MAKKQTASGKAEPDIVIFGASGQLGMELVSQLTLERTVPRAREMLDITDHDAVEELIVSVKPKLVINAAATNPWRSTSIFKPKHWQVNAFAVDNLVKTCALNGAALLHLSTSDVFNQTSPFRPHVELSPVSPVGEYAASKAAGEHAILALSQYPAAEFVNFQYWIVRTSLLYGRPVMLHHNPVHMKLEQALRSRTPVKLPTSVMRSATYVPHLVKHLMWLIDNYQDIPSGIYNIACKGEVSLHDLICEARRQVDTKSMLPIYECTKSEFAASEPFTADEIPNNGLLDCTRWEEICPVPLYHWQDALTEFCDEYKSRNLTT